MGFLARGANPNLASDDGVAPLFAALNNEWALRTWYPQPTAGSQQRASYLQLMEALLKGGADPERAHALAHLVRGVQHRPHGRRVHRRDAVLARGLRARRGGDAPARAATAPTRPFRRCRTASARAADRHDRHSRRAAGRSARAAVPRGERRRLRHVARRPAASPRAGRLDAGGEVLPRGAGRRRQHARRRRLHGAPSRRRTRRQRR